MYKVAAPSEAAKKVRLTMLFTLLTVFLVAYFAAKQRFVLFALSLAVFLYFSVPRNYLSTDQPPRSCSLRIVFLNSATLQLSKFTRLHAQHEEPLRD